MGKILVFILIGCFAVQACKKSAEPGADAVIVGWNYGTCVTCGGFYVNLSNDTTRNANTVYALNYATSLNPIIINFFDDYARTKAPIYVHITWTPIPGNDSTWIHVTSIQSR